jgi:hypothetical protein
VKQLLAAIALATLAYSGWWFYAANGLRGDVETWFDAQKTAGLEAQYSDITVRGFPNRTDLTLTDPTLVSADGRFGWSAPFLQILALTYKKGHVIVAWPDTQTLTSPDGEIAVTSDGMRASMIYSGNTVLRTNLEAAVLNLAGSGRTLALADVNAALQRTDPAPSTYRVALSAGSLAVPSSEMVPSSAPASLASFRAELDMSFDQPLTFDMLAQAAPRPTAIDLYRSEISYGSVTFKLTGAATLDDQGRATGEVSITAENWRDALVSARTSGDLPPVLADGLADLLTLLASLTGSRDTLDVTLGLEKGTVLLGPLPVGTLPPLAWR